MAPLMGTLSKSTIPIVWTDQAACRSSKGVLMHWVPASLACPMGWSLSHAGCFASEIEAKYDKKMRVLRDELDLRRKTEIHEIEERKNGQINTLMKNHEKAFSDIKNYYNDVTLNNLALINTLKVTGTGVGTQLGRKPSAGED